MIKTKEVENIDKELHENSKSELKIRKIQAIYGQKSLLLCIPIEFIKDLGIVKGDYVKCMVNNKNQLVVEKAFSGSQHCIVENSQNEIKGGLIET